MDATKQAHGYRREIIFLRNEGKTSYANVGTFRLISIPPFIGKVLEKILPERLAKHLNRVKVWDKTHEGSPGTETLSSIVTG